MESQDFFVAQEAHNPVPKRRPKPENPPWKKIIVGFDVREPTTPSRTVKQCGVCSVWFELPTAHADRHHSCSSECLANKRAAVREARTAACEHCGKSFLPRPGQLKAGGGRFCGLKCSSTHMWIDRPELRDAMREVAAKVKQKYASGELVRLKGEANPQWQGGPKAARERAQKSGKLAAHTRAYRANNPHKVREFAQSRARRKCGRLPRGTVAKIAALQQNRRALCRVDITDHFHVDHIYPLARGGLHEPSNIQLLCPTCNVRKSSRDPIVYAQMLGKLL